MRFLCMRLYLYACYFIQRRGRYVRIFLVNNQTITYLILVIVFGSVLFRSKNLIKTRYE
jgi:hypothetical protein